jgi:hypothetical protein
MRLPLSTFRRRLSTFCGSVNACEAEMPFCGLIRYCGKAVEIDLARRDADLFPGGVAHAKGSTMKAPILLFHRRPALNDCTGTGRVDAHRQTPMPNLLGGLSRNGAGRWRRLRDGRGRGLVRRLVLRRGGGSAGFDGLFGAGSASAGGASRETSSAATEGLRNPSFTA